MSPTSPSAMSWRIIRTAGTYSKTWPTMSTRPLASASSASSIASAVDSVSGFSTKTCLPASSAARASGGVGRGRRGDHDGGDRAVLEHAVHVVGHLDVRVERGGLLAALVGEVDQVAPAVRPVSVEVAGQVRPPVPVPDQGDAVHTRLVRLPPAPAERPTASLVRPGPYGCQRDSRPWAILLGAYRRGRDRGRLPPVGHPTQSHDAEQDHREERVLQRWRQEPHQHREDHRRHGPVDRRVGGRGRRVDRPARRTARRAPGEPPGRAHQRQGDQRQPDQVGEQPEQTRPRPRGAARTSRPWCRRSRAGRTRPARSVGRMSQSGSLVSATMPPKWPTP